MKKKLKHFIIAIMCVLLINIPIKGNVYATIEEKESMPTDFSIIDDPSADEVTISYNTLKETEDGNFLFTRTDTINNARGADEVTCYQQALVVPTTDEYYNELKLKLNESLEITDKTRGTRTEYDEKVDSSKSYTIFTSVVFTTKTYDSVKYAKVTSASGGYTNKGNNYVGSGMYVRSQEVVFKTYGRNVDGERMTQMTTETPSKTNSGWSYSAPSSWQPVFCASDTVCTICCAYSVVAGRGSSGTTGTTTTLATHYV